MGTEMMALAECVFGNKAVRMFGTKWDLWFVGIDVATALGYKRPRNAISRFVDEDDSLLQGVTDALGREQETILINESGMYALIFGSSLPEAKKFKHWVTHEVLPSIRQYGYYRRPHVPSIEREILNDKGLKYVLTNGEAITAAQTKAYCVVLGANTVFAYEKSTLNERLSYINTAMERRGYSTLAEAHKKWYRLQEA